MLIQNHCEFSCNGLNIGVDVKSDCVKILVVNFAYLVINFIPRGSIYAFFNFFLDILIDSLLIDYHLSPFTYVFIKVFFCWKAWHSEPPFNGCFHCWGEVSHVLKEISEL